MAKSNEAKIKFTAETGEFNSRIKSADSTLKELRSELKLNAAEMKSAGESAEKLKERQKILAKELEASEEKTDALSKKLKKAKEIFGEDSEEAKKLQTQLNNARIAEENIKAEIKSTNEQLKKQKTALQEVGEKADQVGDKLINAGKNMSVVSAGIVAVGAASVAAFNEVDEGADNAIKATGATGRAAEELEEAYKNVTTSIVGDFGTIGSTLGEVNTRFGLTGEKLEKATEKFMKFSEITGVDSTEAVKSVSRALNDAGIPLEEYDTLLDQLAKAGQSAGIDVNTLASSLSENGSIMRSMGFNTQETIALLSQFELSGANSTVMLSGMKKAMATWAKEGKNGNTEFMKTVEGIKTGSVTASDAIEIFGTKAGPMLVDAIKSGKFEYKDMLSTIQNSKGTLESTFDGTVDGGYKMELAMQNAKVALAEVGNTLASTLAPIVESVSEKLKGFANWWSGLDENVQKTIITITAVVAAIGPVLMILGSMAKSITAITTVINMLKASTIAQTIAQWAQNAAWLACPITWIILAIVAAVGALIAIFSSLWKNSEGFREFWENMWEGVKNIFSGIGNWFKEKFTAAKEAAVNAWSNFKDKMSEKWEATKKVFAPVGNWFKEKFTKAKEEAASAFSNLKDKLSPHFEKAKNAVGKIADKIKGFFKGEFSMPKIKLPHFKISPPGWKFSDLFEGSIPKLNIEWYSKAMTNPMILKSPTIFGASNGKLLGGGEAGSEMIGGTNTIMSMIQGAVDRSMRAYDIQSLAAAVEELASRPIEMNINGRQFALATASDTDNVGGLRNTFKSRGLMID